ncbi:protein argonaute-4-like isoform X2 [Eriocheir sinensis]|nr:protein argonaute-4-like isoform X2 [Eriocheir sinensis]
MEDTLGEQEGGTAITLTTNLYRLVAAPLTPTPSPHPSKQSPLATLTSIPSPCPSSPTTNLPSSASILPSSSSSSTTTAASSLITYRLIICEEGKAQVDLPLPARRQVLESLKEVYPEVFGGRPLTLGPGNTALSLDHIPETHDTAFVVDEVKSNGCGRTFAVELRKEKEVPVARVLEVVQCPPPTITTSTFGSGDDAADIIKSLQAMVQYNLSLYMEQRGDLFFPQPPPLPPTPITPAREVQTGYRVTLTPAASLLLSLDVCQPVVTKEAPVIDFLRTDLGWQEDDLRSPMSGDARYELTRLLRDIKVRATHSSVGRVYRVVEVAARGADSILLHIHNPHTATTTPWTVEQYFLHFYGLRLKYPTLNCLHVAPKQRLIFLPLEVCTLVGGQNVSGRGGAWVAGEGRQAIEWDLGPEERQQCLATLVRSPPLAQDPCLTRLGLTVDQKPVRVLGRVLAPPRLLASVPVVPEGGRWVLGEGGVTLRRPVTMHTWSVVQYDVDGRKKNTLHLPFVERLIEVGRSLGMEMKQPSVDVVRKETKPIDDLFALEMYYPYLQLTLFLMRPGIKYLHEDTKHACNTLLERITQCIEPETYRSKVTDDQVMRSLLLQMNAKCGGVSVTVDWPAMMPVSSLMCRPALVVGATVEGHSSDFPRSCYLAAMVGMMTTEGGPCVTLVHPQHRHHYVANMASNISSASPSTHDQFLCLSVPSERRLLVRYYEMNHCKPEAVLVYRLEVPEGQVERVTSWEAEEIHKACRSMQPDEAYLPPLTYLCISRIHHTRLFRGPGEGCGNVLPGTVAQDGITYPSSTAFFLCSHPSDKGTSRPTQYHVICDENNLSLEALQTITYGLCHLHANCTHATPLPMPAAYARQAARYARQLARRQEGHVSKLETPYDPVPLVTKATLMDHYNKLHTTLYYL